MRAEERPTRMDRRKHGRKPALLVFSILLILLGGGMVGFWILSMERPNTDRVDPDFKNLSKPIVIQGEVQDLPAIGEGEGLKLPLPVLQAHIDPAIRYEASNQSVILTTEDRVLRMHTDQLTALVNEQPQQLRFPAEAVEDTIYVPIGPLEELYGLTVEESLGTGAVILRRAGDIVRLAKAKGAEADDEPGNLLRLSDTVKSPIVADLEAGEELSVIRETENGWFLVQLANGVTGFIPEGEVILDRVILAGEPERSESFVPWKPLGGKINLSWEAIYNNRNPDTSKIEAMPGLNVLSPTWFRMLEDEQGQVFVENWADQSYVKWAHERGYQVWALFSNDFDPDLTDKALRDPDIRRNVILQLLSYAEMYDLQGINIDFENVYLENSEHLTQFVRELTPLFHEQGMVVSIDVTIRGGSAMWSLFYDRKALGQIVDYMMVMTYDEHWASSPVAGSVASLPWVEKGITDIMREDGVPASKLVLGVPYYTRVWSETTESGEIKVKSEAVSMGYVERLIQEKQLVKTFDDQTGQHYVEYMEEDVRYRIWIEDETSMRARAELVKKHGLAGIASWRRGFETDDIWKAIEETLDQRP